VKTSNTSAGALTTGQTDVTLATSAQTTNQCTAIDHLAKIRSINVERRVERRIARSDGSDRRAEIRSDANGEPKLDRRAEVRMANALSLANRATKKAA